MVKNTKRLCEEYQEAFVRAGEAKSDVVVVRKAFRKIAAKLSEWPAKPVIGPGMSYSPTNEYAKPCVITQEELSEVGRLEAVLQNWITTQGTATDLWRNLSTAEQVGFKPPTEF